MRVKVLPGHVVDNGKKIFSPGQSLDLKKNDALRLIRCRIVISELKEVEPNDSDKTGKDGK